MLYISLHRHDDGNFFPGSGAVDEVTACPLLAPLTLLHGPDRASVTTSCAILGRLLSLTDPPFLHLEVKRPDELVL